MNANLATMQYDYFNIIESFAAEKFSHFKVQAISLHTSELIF